MPDNITAYCKIDAKTYLDFNRFHRFYSNRSSINIIIFPALIVAFAIFNFVLGNTIIGWILFAFAIIAPAFILIKFRLDVGLKIKEFDLKENPRTFYTITFDSGGIHIKNKKETADYKWDNVFSIYKTNKYTYLYLTKINAFIIPNSSINNASQNELIDLFCTHGLSNKLKNVTPAYER